jgi:hypothetical protein
MKIQFRNALSALVVLGSLSLAACASKGETTDAPADAASPPPAEAAPADAGGTPPSSGDGIGG